MTLSPAELSRAAEIRTKTIGSDPFCLAAQIVLLQDIRALLQPVEAGVRAVADHILRAEPRAESVARKLNEHLSWADDGTILLDAKPAFGLGIGTLTYAEFLEILVFLNKKRRAEPSEIKTPHVWGSVKLWGSVVEHADGYRASKARIVSLEGVTDEAFERLRRRYGVSKEQNA